MSTSDNKASNNNDFFEEVAVEEQTNEEIEQSSPPQSAMSAGFALDGALAEAASASLLITEARTADSFGFAQEGEEGSGSWITNPLVLGGLGALTGLVIWAASSGGGNKPPTVDSPNLAVTVAEDDQINIAINATDPDGDNLVYAVTSKPGNGVTGFAGNTVVYEPFANYNGADSFVVTITDTKGNTVTQTVNITVTPVNDLPQFEPRLTTKAIFQGQTLSENVAGTATDVDGDMLSFAAGSISPEHGELVVNSNGTYVYTPDLNFVGADAFRIAVSDNMGGSDEQGIVVQINPIPIQEPPTGISPQEAVTQEDKSFNFSSTIVDPNGDPISFTNPTLPQNGKLFTFGGLYSYRPSDNFNGMDTFVLRGTTPDGKSFDETWNVTVTPVNDAPTAPITRLLTTAEETPIIIPLVVSDIDLDATLNHPVTDRITPIVLAEDMPTNGVLTVDGNTLTYTPNEGFTGEDQFDVTYRDREGATAKTLVSVTVTDAPSEPIDRAPTGTNPVEAVTDEDVALVKTSDIIDPDGDAIDFSVGANPGNGTVAVEKLTGTYTYNPNADFNGQDSFLIRGTSLGGGEFLQRVDVTINAVNDDPEFPDEVASISTEKSEAISFDLSVGTTDVDGDTLTFSNTTDPQNGVVSVGDDGKTTYTPDPDFVGTDTFQVRVIDNNGGIDTATVEITVTGVGGAEEVSLNGIDPSQPPGEFDASTGSFILILDATKPAHIRVPGFGDDDIFRIVNATPDDFLLVPGGSDGFFFDSDDSPMSQRVFFTDIFAESGPPVVLDYPGIETVLGRNPFDFVTPVP